MANTPPARAKPTAAAAASAAQSDATSALSTLTNIASDSLLTPDEKPRVIMDRDVIVAEQSGIDAQATNYSVTTEKTTYDNAVSALEDFPELRDAVVAVAGEYTLYLTAAEREVLGN